MKAADIKEGVVYAHSHSRFDGPHFKPDEAFVLQIGGWTSGFGSYWSSTAYAHPDAKDSLMLVHLAPIFRDTEDISAPVYIAAKYTRTQAVRYLDALRNRDEPAEEDRPPIGWRVITDSNRTIHQTWDEWAVEKVRREQEARVLLDKQREARALAAEQTAHIQAILGTFGVLDATIYPSQETVTLTFEQIEQIGSRLGVDA